MMAQPKFNCFAVTPPGTEEICAREIVALGLEASAEAGGVSFVAIPRDLYRVNLWSRVASRVLVRIGQFKCRDFPELYRQLVKLPWGRFIRPGQPCGVQVTCQTSRLNHSGRVSETVIAACEKALGEKISSASTSGQSIFIRIVNDQCVVSIDSSGELLHRRGYRQSAVAAPLRENLAAAILLKLNYDGTQPLIDAMTGSGTFAIEAALIAAGVAPGRLRDFAFMDWPHYRPHVWALCLQEKREPGTPGSIRAIDRNPAAVEAARKNALAAGVDSLLRIEEGEMESLQAPGESGILVMNPPYGERLGNVDRLRPLYAKFGELCRASFRGWTIGWISADRKFESEARIGCRRLWSFSNGGIRVELRQRVGEMKPEKS